MLHQKRMTQPLSKLPQPACVESRWAMDNDAQHGAWGFFQSCTDSCPPSAAPPPPPLGLTCPEGETVDIVADEGDNGSCDVSAGSRGL